MNRHRAILFCVLLCMAIPGLAWLNGQFAFNTDDAYVPYRYAMNAADGNGLVYNPGEHVLATKSPLVALLLVPGRAFGNIPRLADFYNVLFAAITLALVYLLAHQLCRSHLAALTAAVAVASIGEFLVYSMMGLPLPLFLMLAMAAWCFHQGGRPLAAGICAGLAMPALLNPASFALVAAIAAELWILKRGGELRRYVLGAALIAIPWFMFSAGYFGQLLPRPLHGGGARMLLVYYFKSPMAVYLLIPAIVGAAAFGRNRRFLRKYPAAAGMCLWIVLNVLASVILGNDRQPWLLAPVALPLVLLGVFGAQRALIGFVMPWRSTPAMVRRVNIAVAICLAPFVLAQSAKTCSTMLREIKWNAAVEPTRYDVAQYLAQNGKPGDRLMDGGVGLIGYYSNMFLADRRIVVNPDALPNAQWKLRELTPGVGKAPRIDGYKLVKLSQRDASVFRLGLYAKKIDETFGAGPYEARGIEYEGGLVLDALTVGAAGIDVVLHCNRPPQGKCQFFAHVYDRSDSKLLWVENFAPAKPIAAMKPGEHSEAHLKWAKPLPEGGAVVHLGIYDDSTKDYPRLPLLGGDDAIKLIYRGAEKK